MRGQCGRWGVGGAVAVLAVTATVARADIALTYLAPAEGCPAEAAVDAAMRDELADEDFGPDGTTIVIARVATSGGRFSGVLTIAAPGQPAHEDVIAADADCAVVADALVVALRRYHERHPAAVASHAHAVADDALPPASAEAMLAFGAVGGLFGQVAPSFAISAQSLHDGWSLGGRFRYAQIDEDDAAKHAAELAVIGCARGTLAHGCAFAGIGFRSVDTYLAGTDTRYGLLGARLGLELPLGRHVALAPAVEVQASFENPNDEYDARVTATGELGVVFYARPTRHRAP